MGLFSFSEAVRIRNESIVLKPQISSNSLMICMQQELILHHYQNNYGNYHRLGFYFHVPLFSLPISMAYLTNISWHHDSFDLHLAFVCARFLLVQSSYNFPALFPTISHTMTVLYMKPNRFKHTSECHLM